MDKVNKFMALDKESEKLVDTIEIVWEKYAKISAVIDSEGKIIYYNDYKTGKE